MFCPSCGTSNVDTARYCQSCGGATTAAAYVPPPAPVPSYAGAMPRDPRIRDGVYVAGVAARYAVGRSPILAAILSVFIVGLGQLYNGDYKKGVVMFFVAIGSAIVTIYLFGVGWPVIMIWSAVDAYNVARCKSPLW